MSKLDEMRNELEELNERLHGAQWRNENCACHNFPPCPWCMDGPGSDPDGELQERLSFLENLLEDEAGPSAVASVEGVGLSAPGAVADRPIYQDFGEDLELSPEEIRDWHARRAGVEGER